MEMDAIDTLAAQAFDGFIVRKDLVRRFKNQYPVPTYVVEFLLGRYCASVDEQEIQDGLQIVQRQLVDRAVRAGTEELFKSRAREKGAVKIIDLVTARLDAKSDAYVAELPSLRLRDVRIDARLVQEHDRMLTGGFYAEIELAYDATIAQEHSGRPFGIDTLRAIQLSKRNVLDTLTRGRSLFTTEEWKKLLIRSIGLEPEALSPRAQDIVLLRMVPFVERNYNMVCFDEISGVSFDQKDGVNIMKGYMESAEFSRGKESIRADGGIVMVGNFDVDVQHQQRVGHLFGPLPPEMRHDTAFMDRIHAYVPGWDIPKLNTASLTEHFGLVSDFLSECWTQLRAQSRMSALMGRVVFGVALSGRDTTAVHKTVSGLLKLLHPQPDEPVPDDNLEWAVRLALECRRRVKEQQKRIGSAEFRNTQFSYTLGQDGVEKFVVTPELQSEDQIGTDPLPPGPVWAIGPSGQDEGSGLYRIAVTEGPGSGVRILNRPAPQAFAESVKYAEANLYSRASELVGDRNPREHEFSIQLRAFDT